jgi:hypothetical protein
MFHARDGLYFKNNLGIQVIVTSNEQELHVVGDKVSPLYTRVIREIGLTVEQFASVVASMSLRGETNETYQEAYNFLTRAPKENQ